MSIAAVIVASLSLTSSTSSAIPDSHCRADETIAFSCSFGKKLVSLCSSKTTSESSGYLQYRYGAKTAVELEYPGAPAHPKGNFKLNHLTPMNDDGTRSRIIEVSFQNGDVTYTIVSFLRDNSGDVKLEVSQNGNEIAEMTCLNESIVNPDLGYFETLDQFGLVDGDPPMPNAVPSGQLSGQREAPRETTAPEPTAVNATSTGHFEPTQDGLAKYIQSIEGKEIYLYAGKERLNVFFWIESGLMNHCARMSGIAECKADPLQRLFAGKLEEVTLFGSFPCKGIVIPFAQNHTEVNMLCISGKPFRGVKDERPFSLDTGEPFYIMTTVEESSKGGYSIATLAPDDSNAEPQ